VGGDNHWQGKLAPSLADIEALAARAWQGLPAAFRDMCGDVVIRVEDFATDEVLAALKLHSPFDLMGLYHGVSLDRRSVLDLPRGPDMIFLYRRALLDYWVEHEEALDRLVSHVLIHEIGHHFGLSDADMAHIEAEADA
jgi:predicted Zn-dependent protease with MMP-like domain